MINGKKVIGIIGGMGPMATADLFRKLVSLTDADSEGVTAKVLSALEEKLGATLR